MKHLCSTECRVSSDIHKKHCVEYIRIVKFKPVAFQEFEEAKINKILIQFTIIYNYSYSIITFYFYTNLNGDINFASKL